MIRKYLLLFFVFFIFSNSYGQILSEDFSSAIPNENFSKVGWTNFAEEGTIVFQGKYFDTEDNYYVQMSAFGSGELSNVAWLVTPSVYIAPGNVLNFRSKSGYTNADVFSLWISSDFSGDVTTATWTELSFNKPTDDGSSYGDWQNSGAIILDGYAGSNVCFAFKHIGGDPSATTTWQIDDILVSQAVKLFVSPTSFIEEVESGSMVNSNFTISNVGGGILTWERSRSFSKADYADWELEENQLQLTNDVSITRKNNQGLFNIAQETAFTNISPVGTQWSYGLTNELSIDQYEAWAEAVNWSPPSQVGQNLSMNIIGTDIFFDIMFSSWTSGSEGGGFSLDYTLPLASWIEISVESGSIASGESIEVNVTFDATELLAGEYLSQIRFFTNDSENPMFSIPVELTVTGEPEINITETSIDYGDLFVKGTSTYELVIENVGTDALSISSITSDEAAFVSNLSEFIIEPKSSQIVEVSFNPTEILAYTGTLTINSDDADEAMVTLSLSGNGIPAPDAVVDPASLDVTLTGCDISETHSLNIENVGGHDLEWNFLEGLGYPRTKSILVIQEASEWGVYMNAFIETNFDLTSTVINSSQIEETDFNLYDIIITTGSQSGTYYSNISNNVAKFESFVEGGGIVQYQAATQGANVSIVGGVNVIYGSQENVNTNLLPSHPITNELPIDLNGSSANHCYFTNLPADVQIITETKVSHLPTTVEYDYGYGKVIATGMTWGHLYTNSFNSGPMLYNSTEYSLSLIGSIPSWLTISTTEGVITPGNTTTIEMEFNSTGLEIGTYSSTLILQSNDSDNPIIDIPITLTVEGIPTIELSTASIDFLNVVIGSDLSKIFTISNTGCETLEITDIISSSVQFTTDAILPLTVEPNETIEIIVTFSPTEELVYDETLTIVNNDEEKTIAVIGEGMTDAPVITLSEESFVVTYDVCDDVQTYTLTVFNTTGLANLNYEIAQDQEGEMVTISSGTILPGESADEGIEIDATGFISGDYDYQLFVTSNDPLNPTITVSYTLTVNGVPTIEVSTSSIDFGEVFVNDIAVETITITNSGCGTLNVTDITSSLPEFTVDNSTFSLLPEETIDIEVTFSPLTDNSFSGTLTIVNNDTEEIIDVIGTGLVSPIVELNPVAVDVTLEGCDDIQEETLTILNSGTGDLNWELLTFQDYGWKDSKQPDGPVFSWFDISEIGTFTNLQGDDNNVSVDLPFTFTFYEQDKSSMRISTNGYLTFGGDGTDFSNDDIPNANDPNDYIAPLWDDLNGAGDGKVYYYHDSQKSRFIVQYSDWPNLNGSGTYDFQIHLYANGEIYFYYQNLNGTLNGSTIGIENSNGTEGLKIAYNQTYLENNLAIKISNILPFDSDPSSGTIAAGSSQDVTLTFDANDYADGTFLTTYFLNSNDPANPMIEIPVSVTLVGVPEILISDETLAFNDVIFGQSLTNTLTITNTGCSALSVTDIVSSAVEFTVDNTSFNVMPNESVDVNVTFTPSDVLEYNGTLTISNDDTEQIVTLVGTTLGASEISVTPDSYTLTAVNCDDQIAETLTISNIGATDLSWEVDQTTGVPSWLNMSSYVGTVNASGSIEIDLLFDASVLTSGVYSSNIVIDSNDPANPSVSIPVSFTVEGAPAIEVSPLSLDFGEVNNGDSFQLDFAITNNGCADLEVANIESDNAMFTSSNTTFSVAPGDIEVITVTYSPTAEGEHTANITITSNDAEQTVTLAGVAIASGTPIIRLLNTSLSFGDVYLGHVSEVQQYDISGLNLTDDIAINVPYGFQISTSIGSGFGNSITLTQVAGIVSETTIYVRFVPTAQRAYNENVTHVSSGATQKNIAVTGNGIVPPNILTSVQSLNFADVYVNNQSAEKTYNISASGLLEDLTISAPDGFAIANTSGGDFGATLTYTPVNGVVSTSAVFVKFLPNTVDSYIAEIEHASTGATTKFVTLTGTSLATYSITFNVSDGVDPISGAEVALTGYGSQTTDATGVAIFTEVIPESEIAYSIIAADYDDVAGTVSVVNADVIENITMELTTYGVTFTVTDGTDPISGAEVALAGYGTQTTDATGIALFAEVVPEEAISYTVTAAGYDDATGTVTVLDADVAEGVTMVLTTYTVTFTVTDQNDAAIEGAEIVIDETHNLTTDASGTASIELVDGTFAFTVAKDGYEGYSDSFTVNGENLSIPVAIHTTGVETGFFSTVKVYPNPFTTSITIDNALGVKHMVINTLIGQKVMEVELQGLESETIATDMLANGIYLITLENDRGEVVVKKLVKQ